MRHGPDCIPPDEVGDFGHCCCNGEYDDDREREEDEWVLDCGDPNCCMPSYHFRSECHTPEMMEAQYEEMERDSAEAGPSP